MQNPFRVLGVAVTATERDIQKQITKTTRFAEVGKEISSLTDFLCFGELKRDSDSVSKAANSIEQPLNKLIHSFSWFWGVTHIDSFAFDSLSKGDTDKAIEIWGKVVKDGKVSSKNFSSLFNLKSLYTILGIEDNKIDVGLFTKGVLLSGNFFNHNDLDNYVTQIIGEHVTIAREDLEKKYITYLNGIVAPFLDKPTGLSIKEFISGFETFSEGARQYVTDKFVADPINSLNEQINTAAESRKKNPIEGAAFGQALYDNSKDHLKLLSGLIGKSEVKYQMIANKLAEEILQCSIDFFNQVREDGAADKKQGQLAAGLCKYALQISCEGQIKSRIEETKEIIDDWVKDALDALNQHGIIVKNALNHGYEVFANQNSGLHSTALTLINTFEAQKAHINEKNLFQLSDEVAQLVIALAIKHANNDTTGNSSFGAKALFDRISTFKMATDTLNRFLKNREILARNSRQQSQFGCYVATMVYGSYEHPQVLILREFRDNFLASYLLGRLFIKFYYKYSPQWVAMLRDNDRINSIIKKCLNQVIKYIK